MLPLDGAGTRNRTQAFWERGSKKIATVPRPPDDSLPVAKKQRPSRVPGTVPPFRKGDVFYDGLNESRFRGLNGKNAWHYIENVGPTVNDIVEVHPDKEAKRAGQRWFMIVKKANVIEHMGKPCIELCRWCKTDTLEPCNLYKEPELCRIECVIAYGVREAGVFDTVRNVTSAKLTPTLTQQQVTAAKDAESSSSDSDAPITKAAISQWPRHRQQDQKNNRL